MNSILEANRSTGFKENRGKLTEFFANGVMLCTIQGLRNLKASKSLSPRYLRSFDICRFKIHYSQGIYNGFHEPGTPLIDLVLCISSLVSAWRSELTLASPKWFTTTASIRSRQLVSISTHLLHFVLSFTNSECFLCISICFQVLNTLPYPIPWIQNVPHFTRAVRNIQLPYIINETSL